LIKIGLPFHEGGTCVDGARKRRNDGGIVGEGKKDELNSKMTIIERTGRSEHYMARRAGEKVNRLTSKTGELE